MESSVMTSQHFRPGDRVRCVEPCERDTLTAGEYTIADANGALVALKERANYGIAFYASRFVLLPTAQPASVPEAGGECQFCTSAVPAGTLVCTFCRDAGCRSHVSGGLPDTARAILDLGRTQPQQPVVHKPQQAAASDGIGRAVRALSNHEPRLGCHRYQP
jgi:hypothetical protein